MKCLGYGCTRHGNSKDNDHTLSNSCCFAQPTKQTSNNENKQTTMKTNLDSTKFWNQQKVEIPDIWACETDIWYTMQWYTMQWYTTQWYKMQWYAT